MNDLEAKGNFPASPSHHSPPPQKSPSLAQFLDLSWSLGLSEDYLLKYEGNL